MGTNNKNVIVLKDLFLEKTHIGICPFSTDTEMNVPEMILHPYYNDFVGDIITNDRYSYNVHGIGEEREKASPKGYTYQKTFYRSDGTEAYTRECYFKKGRHILPVLYLDTQKVIDYMESNPSKFDIVSSYNNRPCIRVGRNLTMPILNWTKVSNKINPMSSGREESFIEVALPPDLFNKIIDIKTIGWVGGDRAFDDLTSINSVDSIPLLLKTFEESSPIFNTPIEDIPAVTKLPDVERLIKLLKINSAYEDVYKYQRLRDEIKQLKEYVEKLESANNVTRKSQEEKTRRLQDELNAMRQEEAERNDIRVQAARLKRLVESERAETVKARAYYVMDY